MSKCIDTFFDTPREQSIIKKLIVTKYFPAWANVMKSNVMRNRNDAKKNLAYFDLFCGPGKYNDGTTSTPVDIMRKILSDEFLRNHCITLFNDCNSDFISTLEENLESLEGFELLKHSPILLNEEVSLDIFKSVGDKEIIPTLSFIDPFGYKGVSADLLSFLIRSFGCDLILFFNYNEINRSISNKGVEKHISSIFTEQIHNELKELVKLTTTSEERERVILNKFSEAINDCYRKDRTNPQKIYVFPFRFQFEDKERTSHYVIFLTKNKLGLKIMKDIMWGLDNNKENQIASFEYIPNNNQLKIPNIFNVEELKIEILNLLSAKDLYVAELTDYYLESFYIVKNIKTILLELESKNKIIVKNRKRKNTMPEHALISLNK